MRRKRKINRKVVLVVGDKFGQFAVGKDVMTLSQVNELIDESNTTVLGQTPIVLVPGQGLGEREVEALLVRARKSSNLRRLDFSQWKNIPKRACRSKSHKQSLENTLISEPYRLARDVFEMHLLIDAKSELMQDHQTGQHLQGILFIEAARQSQIAITEAFFMPKDGHYSFVFNDISVQYNYFSFPFPAKLRCVIRERDFNKEKRRQSIISDVSIIQNGADTVSMTMKSSIRKTKNINNCESWLAERATNRYIKKIKDRLSLEENNDIVING